MTYISLEELPYVNFEQLLSHGELLGLNNAFEVKLSCVLVFQSMLRTVQLLQKLVHPRPSLLRLSYPCSSDSVQASSEAAADHISPHTEG